MKTNLFDKNGIEIQIGDKYINPKFPNDIYTVFWKGGAVCGGVTEDVAKPLCWEYFEDELSCDEDCTWLKIKPNLITEEEFKNLAINFLKYSFGYPFSEKYEDLTIKEKEFCSSKQYDDLLKYIKYENYK